MEIMGFDASSPAIRNDQAKEVIAVLDDLARNNQLEGRYVHSVILAWEEALLFEDAMIRQEKAAAEADDEVKEKANKITAKPVKPVKDKNPRWLPYTVNSVTLESDGTDNRLRMLGEYKNIAVYFKVKEYVESVPPEDKAA